MRRARYFLPFSSIAFPVIVPGPSLSICVSVFVHVLSIPSSTACSRLTHCYTPDIWLRFSVRLKEILSLSQFRLPSCCCFCFNAFFIRLSQARRVFLCVVRGVSLVSISLGCPRPRFCFTSVQLTEWELWGTFLWFTTSVQRPRIHLDTLAPLLRLT